MKQEFISIPCPFCKGNKTVKVDITEAIDKKVQEALIKVYSEVKNKTEVSE